MNLKPHAACRIPNKKGKRIEPNIKSVEKAGGKLIGFYSTLGEYDYIGISEGLSDEAAAAFNLELSSQEYVRTTTLRAFTTKEFADMIKNLP